MEIGIEYLNRLIHNSERKIVINRKPIEHVQKETATVEYRIFGTRYACGGAFELEFQEDIQAMSQEEEKAFLLNWLSDKVDEPGHPRMYIKFYTTEHTFVLYEDFGLDKGTKRKEETVYVCDVLLDGQANSRAKLIPLKETPLYVEKDIAQKFKSNFEKASEEDLALIEFDFEGNVREITYFFSNTTRVILLSSILNPKPVGV